MEPVGPISDRNETEATTVSSTTETTTTYESSITEALIGSSSYKSLATTVLFIILF